MMPREWSGYRHTSSTSVSLYYGPGLGNPRANNNATISSGEIAFLPFLAGGGGRIVRATAFVTNAVSGQWGRGAIYQPIGTYDLTAVNRVADVGCWNIGSYINASNSLFVSITSGSLYWFAFTTGRVVGESPPGVGGVSDGWGACGAAQEEGPLSTHFMYTATYSFTLWPSVLTSMTQILQTGGFRPTFFVEIDSR